MEEWRDIPGYEGYYEASKKGGIRSKDRKVFNKKYGITKHLKQMERKQVLSPLRGRIDPRIVLNKDGKRRDYLVARLIALTWCEGYAPGMTVNHKDGNPLNNDASNLEWITLKENIRHGFKTGLYALNEKPVTLYSNGNEYSFSSLAEASRFLGRGNGYVSGRIKKGKTTLTNNKGETFRIEMEGCNGKGRL